MNTPTKEQLTDTEAAVTNWWCGTEFDTLSEDGYTVTDDARRGVELFQEFELETIELLTWFRGYLDTSDTESDVRGSVKDFIMATAIVMGIEL